MLGIALIIFSWAKVKVTNIQAKYPPTFDCTDVDGQFASQPDLYKTYAEIDKPYTDEGQGTGVYLCYCKKNFPGGVYFSKDELCDNYQKSA
jgi:hypothetical protein